MCKRGVNHRVFGTIIRFFAAAVVLSFIGVVLPGIYMAGFLTAIFAAVVIAALGWIIEQAFGRRISPYARGAIGFVCSAVVIFMTQAVVPGVHATVGAGLLCAVIIGFVDLFVPTSLRGQSDPARR
jgi:putative membrane protein